MCVCTCVELVNFGMYDNWSTDALVPKGYVSFPVCGADKEDTKLSYRDVTSPINPEDYKDSSGSRAMSGICVYIYFLKVKSK